jgi:hypothetical protein
MMSLIPWTRAYRAKKLAHESDFGRRYGWFIERDGNQIGELDYIRWDSLGQFWHEYSVVWHSDAESWIEADPDAWIQRKVTLRNKRYPDIVVSEFLIAPRAKGIIVVRFASEPLERFEKDETI